MTNDNPNPENVKRASVNAAREHMKAKTDDEKEFYKRKIASLKTFKQYIKEGIHKNVDSALDHAPVELSLNSARAAHRRLKGKGIDSGIKDLKKMPRGSSRAVLFGKENDGNDIILDGKPVKLPVVLKMAHKGSKRPYQGKYAGQHQNNAEASPFTQEFAVIVQQRDGTWKTNPNGVLPPVVKKGSDDKYLHMAAARDAKPEDFKRLTGLNPWDLGDVLDGYHSRDYKPSRVVVKFMRFKEATGISDFHSENFGVWKHPLTGEEHLVLRDAGFDYNVRNVYNNAEWLDHKSSNKLNKLSRYVKFYRKQIESFPTTPKEKRKERMDKFLTKNNKRKLKQIKEDWKRGALMGAAATAAGALTAKMIGFPVVAGAVLAGGQYALSRNGLRKDLKYRYKRKT